ncbi:hypothetical protein OOK31_34680 [Streptomyces sp. NBC_00249]|uniref:proline-rich domain-containing protein n=1 Tax=Streptomyces sp. NBC_00249 TaxID=2975690 RepID=UPI002252B6B0|nr:proline-rich domain-containing protein [Streptomyces sp. NBC_00249]MCX5198975.1 hypothetical protein [Streptomyces sp. NBC_00249]
MSVQPSEANPEAAPLVRLFDPGQRLGWVYRDAETCRRFFVEQPPGQGLVPEMLQNRARAETLNAADRKGMALKVGGGAAAFFVLIALLTGSVAGWALALLAAAGAAVVHSTSGGSATSAVQQVQKAQFDLEQRYQHESSAWAQRKAYFEYTEDQRIRAMDLWGTLPMDQGTRRLDVFGGSQRSREGFLTVFGASTLRERPLIVLDLTQAQICRELSVLSAQMGAPVDVQLLPSQQEQSSIFDGLAKQELVDALVEAVYGDSGEATRAARSMDTRILGRLCDALGERVTPARIAAGLRALLGESTDADTGPDGLTRAERNHIADDLLTDKNKDQTRENLMRLEAFIQPLATLGTARAGRGPGYLTCLSLDRATGSASTELLVDLAILSVSRRLSTLQEDAPAVVVALGEHEVQRRHLERLASVCEWRGSQLTIMHAHLRETARDMIGGGAVAFMRLGNHQEAGIAADFLGRGYSFKLHSLTDTKGESVNTSVAHTKGTSTSVAHTEGFSRSWGKNWGTSSSSTYSDGGIFPTSSTSGSSSGGSYTETENSSTTRTRGTSESTTHTEGTSVSTSDGTTTQRVYEYALEPTQLQGLQEFSLVFVERAPDGSVRTHTAMCNPNIVKLERVGSVPLDDQPPVEAQPQHTGVPAQPAPTLPPYVPGQPVAQPQQPAAGPYAGAGYGAPGFQPGQNPPQPGHQNWGWPTGQTPPPPSQGGWPQQ